MKAKLISLALGIATLVTIGVVHVRADAVVDTTRDCDTFAVVKCGTMTENEMRAEYDSFGTHSNGTSQNSTTRQGDIHKIYSALGISRADLNGNFVNGVVHRNGDVTVGGKVVARNAKTAARNLGGSAIAGTGAGIVDASRMGSAQTALVKMVGGKFQFAVMKPCGNPVKATPVAEPVAKCTGLDKNKISRNEFSFVGHADVKNGAKIKSYTFVARDKNNKIVATKVVKTDKLNANSGKMTFDKPGTYKVRLLVDSTAGKDLTSADCVKEITVNPEPKPGVSIDKKVNGKESIQTQVGTVFTYEVVVKNTGNVDLKNVAVSDKQPTGVAFVSANVGTIANGEWTHTINELKVGASKSFAIKAKVTEYQEGSIKNTASVDAPAVPGKPDDCDDAYVKVPEPSATCDLARTNYLSKTEFTLTGKASVKNKATVSQYIFTIKNAAGDVVSTVPVTSSALQVTTGKQELTTPGTYTVNLLVKTSVGDRTSNACNTTVKIPEPNMVQVCDPETGNIITVPEEEAGNYKPVGDPACEPQEPEKIEVCELKTRTVITINKVDFDGNLHTTDLSKCDEPEELVEVCDPKTGKIVTVPKGQEGNYKPADDVACKEQPEVLVDTGVGSIVGLFASVTAAGALAHRFVWVPRRNG